MIYLKQSLTIAAYEGGRTAIIPGATSAEVEADCQQVLTDRDVQSATIDITPSNITPVKAGNYIVVEVSAPCNANSLFASWFYSGRTLTGRAEVMKEYD